MCTLSPIHFRLLGLPVLPTGPAPTQDRRLNNSHVLTSTASPIPGELGEIIPQRTSTDIVVLGFTHFTIWPVEYWRNCSIMYLNVLDIGSSCSHNAVISPKLKYANRNHMYLVNGKGPGAQPTTCIERQRQQWHHIDQLFPVIRTEPGYVIAQQSTCTQH